MNRNRTISRRAVLASGVTVAALGIVASSRVASSIGSAPRAVGIADFVFGVGAEDSSVIAMNGWTGEIVHKMPSPVDIVSLFANRTAERIVGIDTGTGRIAIFRNPGESNNVDPIVYEASVAPDLFTFAPDGRHAVYADFGAGELVLLDLHEGKRVRSFTGFDGVHDIRFSGLTNLLTVTSLDRADVRTVDLETGDVSTLVAIADPEGRGIDHMSQTLSGRTGIIIQPGISDAQFVRISNQGGELLRSIRLSSPPLRAFISSDNRYAVLPSTQEPIADIVDLDTLQHVKTLELPGLMTTMQTDPLSRYMVGIAPEASSIVTIDARAHAIVSTKVTDGGADLLALNEESGLCFVLGNSGDSVPAVVPVRQPEREPVWAAPSLSQPMWTVTSTNALAVCH